MDVIEAGFPIASQGRFRGGAGGGRARFASSTVAGLARARREDIEAALGALEPAAKPRVHVFLATSDLHLKHKLRISRDEALESIGTHGGVCARRAARRWNFPPKMPAAAIRIFWRRRFRSPPMPARRF